MLTVACACARNLRAASSLASTVCLLLSGFTGASAFAQTTFGSVAVGTTSSPLTVTLTFTGTATLGAMKVVTQGTTGLDFQPAAGGTCAVGTTYNVDQSCTVAVAFTPNGVGLRMGAIMLYDSASTPNLVATSLISGIGNGGLIKFAATPPLSIAANFNAVGGIAIDAAGNLFVADIGDNAVHEVPACGCPETSIGSGLNSPSGVAVDGAGNVYIADGGNNRVVEVPKSGGAQTTVGIGLSGPDAVAIDGIGNIFVTDHNNARVVLIPAGGGAQTTIGTGFIGPSSVAVDGAGNLYVGDFNGNDVVKVSIVGGAQTTIGTGILAPTGVAVDGAGNVYIAEGNGGASLQNQNVWEVSPIGVQTLIQNGTNSYAVAVDGSGNVLISENAQAVTELFQLGSFVELTYGTVGGAPGTASLPLTNFGTAPLTLARSITPSEFTESDNCGTSVAVNASCIVNLTFTPTSGIPYPGTAAVGTLILSDNAPYTPQTLTLYTLAITLPTQLVFSSPPIASLEPGGNAGAVSVSIEDAYGHVAADDPTPAITLSVTGPSGYAQSYGLDPALGPGFFNLSKSPLYTSGTYTYTATSNGLASATFIETVLPNSFTVPTEPTGQTSPSTAVTVAFSTISTLGTIKVVTQGITELDFQQAPTNSGSCAIGTTYGIGQSCTVNVLFAPKGVGLRMGAVLLYDNAATPNLVATAFLSGIGQAGLLSFQQHQRRFFRSQTSHCRDLASIREATSILITRIMS